MCKCLVFIQSLSDNVPVYNATQWLCDDKISADMNLLSDSKLMQTELSIRNIQIVESTPITYT